MATISFTLSAAAATEVTDAFGADYQATVVTGVDANGAEVRGPNPLTKAQYARAQVIAYLKDRVKAYRAQVAAAAATGVDPDIT